MPAANNLEPIRPKAETCCCSIARSPTSAQTPALSLAYFSCVALFGLLWICAYAAIGPVSNWLVFDLLGFPPSSHLGQSIDFFIYDTVKILLLLFALIYVIAWLRASLNVERVRAYLVGKARCLGYLLGSMFGAITPFCSCSSIPLFLGFTTAGIPFGITMAFLITSPLINEIAVVLLWGLLGWKFTLIYVALGIAAGVIGGTFMDAINAERWLQPFLLDAIHAGRNAQAQTDNTVSPAFTLRRRHSFAWGEMKTIFARVWKWVIIGVAAGAALHGFIPDNWFAQHLGTGAWWSVPAAVIVAIPLYTNVTGIVPVMESLLTKGLPIGTTLAFCMSAVAASIPEFMLLRQIMTFKLQALFIVCLWIIFTLAGWLFNYVGPALIG